jgi:profilin
MSWQTYVDTNLVGTGSVTKAAIVGHDGGSWAASAGFAVGADEAKSLVAAFSVRIPRSSLLVQVLLRSES